MDILLTKDYAPIFNRVGVYMTSFYSQENREIFFAEVDEDVPDDCIRLPYVEQYERALKRRFMRSLSESELETITTGMYGFYTAIGVYGFDDRYHKMATAMAKEALHDWELENSVSLDWNEIIEV